MSVLLGDQPAVRCRRSPIRAETEQDTAASSHGRSVQRATLSSSSGCDSDKNTRRTRVSFELHPTLLIEDFLMSN